MSFFESFLSVLGTEMTRPTVFGWFHIVLTAAFVVLGFWLARRYRNADERCVRRVLFVISLVVILFEIGKQILYTFSFKDGVLTVDYVWQFFPWQFCSTPMYVGLLAGVTRGRFHRMCCAYLSTYAVFAGFCVLCYPLDIFNEYLFINVQTMVCHASMLTVGIFLTKTGYVPCRKHTLYKAIPLFLALLAVAVVMNEIAYRCGVLETDTFNMFFVSPYTEPYLVVYSWIQEAVAFPWCLPAYIVGFTIGGGLMLLALDGIRRLRKKATNEPTAAAEENSEEIE